jgi:hypothetical protein
MLIGTEIDSPRSKRQHIDFLGPGNAASGMKLGCKQAKIALCPREFETLHKFRVKQQEKTHVLNL